MFLLFITPLILSAQTDYHELTSKIKNLLKNSFASSALFAIDIYNLSDNNSIYNQNEKLLLHPASNMKLFTSAAGLYFLDEDYSFDTEFYIHGDIIDSVLFGDLFVIGGFDPLFSSADLNFSVKQIMKAGIKSITGNIYGDVSKMDSLYWGEGWMWDDDPGGFSPYLTPLCINRNSAEIVYRPGRIGSPAEIKVSPSTEYFSFRNTSETIMEDTSDLTITRNIINRTNDISISGTLSYTERVDTSHVNMYRPELYFLTLMKEALHYNGIFFNGIIDTLTKPGSAELIYSFSQPIQKVLMELNKESDNLSAEMLLRALSYEKFGGPATAENGLKLIDSLIIKLGFDLDDYRLVDGSGLSHYNLISAEVINRLLIYVYQNDIELYTALRKTLPVSGISGTLQNRMRYSNVKGKVAAKTGTLSGISCLSGYLKTVSGKDVCFSIMIQNFVEKPRIARYYQDKICEIIIENL